MSFAGRKRMGGRFWPQRPPPGHVGGVDKPGCTQHPKARPEQWEDKRACPRTRAWGFLSPAPTRPCWTPI